jgi:hypothetical protein
MHYVTAKFVPKILTDGQKQQHVNVCKELLRLSPTMKPSCPKLSFVIGVGFIIMILRQTTIFPMEKTKLTDIHKARWVKSKVKSILIIS